MRVITGTSLSILAVIWVLVAHRYLEMTGSSPGSRNAGESSSAPIQPNPNRPTDEADDSSNESALLADNSIEDNPRFQ